MTYFIASAKCYQCKAFNGNVLTHDDEEVFLGDSEGYAQCSTSRRGAHRFTSAEEAKREAERWDGMPWYRQLKPGTLRIFRIDMEEKLVPRLVPVETEVL
jgi:hypothetical protein